MILGHGIGRGNETGHPGLRSVLVKRIRRTMKQALTRHRTATEAGATMDMREHLNTVTCHRCERRFDAVSREKGNGKRFRDPNYTFHVR